MGLALKQKDPLINAIVATSVEGQLILGTIIDIEVDLVTRELLYLVRYEDGEFQHMTAQQVNENLHVPP